MSKFTVMQARRDNQPVIIVVDMALAPGRESSSYPFLLTVRIPMRSPNPATGLCDQPESARLDSVEDALLGALSEADYRLVGHVTGNGAREVLIYTCDPDNVTHKLNSVLQSTGETSAVIEREEDREWAYVRRFLTAL